MTRRRLLIGERWVCGRIWLRLIAILGSLLLEYDDGARHSSSFAGAVANVESDVYRIQTYASVCLLSFSFYDDTHLISYKIQDLISKHLLHRTTPSERIDGMQFKCGLTHEQGLALARRLNIPLAELMWDPI